MACLRARIRRRGRCRVALIRAAPRRLGAGMAAVAVAALCAGRARSRVWVAGRARTRVPAARRAALQRLHAARTSAHRTPLANGLLHLLEPLLFTLWGIWCWCWSRSCARPAARRAGGRARDRRWRRSRAELLKPLLAHPHAAGRRRLRSAPRPGRAATRRRRLRSCCAPCSSRRARLRPLGRRVGVVFVAGRRLLAADPRLAHAERRARRLPARLAVGGARRCRPARLRARWPRARQIETHRLARRQTAAPPGVRAGRPQRL